MALSDDFRREPPYPPDFLFSEHSWSGVGDLNDLRGLERRLEGEGLVPLSYVRLHQRLGFALLTADMQARWRKAYARAEEQNRAVFEDVLRLSETRPLIVLGGAAMLLTVHEDPGTRALDAVELLAEEADMPALRLALASAGYQEEGWSFRRADGVPIALQSRLEWPCVALDAGPLRTHAIPARPADAPLPADVAPLEFIAAVEIAAPPPGGGERPQIMRAMQRADRDVLERMASAAGIRVLAAGDALLYFVAASLQRPAGAAGIYRWEMAERLRRGDCEWGTFLAEARRHGLSAAAHHSLSDLCGPWRAPVPQ
ncbi:MAG: nucleotidyltransferase family protein, partial [Armatimonadetes bacterium]|nr:nucleotidyltransferase family protein [Armatimonadota bacterium]